MPAPGLWRGSPPPSARAGRGSEPRRLSPPWAACPPLPPAPLLPSRRWLGASGRKALPALLRATRGCLRPPVPGEGQEKAEPCLAAILTLPRQEERPPCPTDDFPFAQPPAQDQRLRHGTRTPGSPAPRRDTPPASPAIAPRSPGHLGQTVPLEVKDQSNRKPRAGLSAHSVLAHVHTPPLPAATAKSQTTPQRGVRGD